MEENDSVESRYLALQDYGEVLRDLPTMTQAHLNNIREFDIEIQTALQKMRAILKTVLSMTEPSVEKWELYEEVIDAMKDVLQKSDRKVWEASKAYDVVDEYVRRADEDIRKFSEDQLSVPKLHMGPGARKVSGRNASASSAGVAAAAAAGSYLPASNPTNASDGRKRKRGLNAATNKDIAPVAQILDQDVDELDLPIDPNEPRYCYCRDYSYGQMVACDGEDCELEWFHLDCANLRDVPSGKWYCRECADKMKRQRRG